MEERPVALSVLYVRLYVDAAKGVVFMLIALGIPFSSQLKQLKLNN